MRISLRPPWGEPILWSRCNWGRLWVRMGAEHNAGAATIAAVKAPVLTTLPNHDDAQLGEVAVVVVVDDDSDSCRAVQALLASAGYYAQAVEDGFRLLEMIRNERIDVVLLEADVSGLNGLEVCRRLRAELGFRIGIIFLSDTRSEAWDQIAGLEAGGDDYITKPFDPGELVARVGALVRRLRAGNGNPSASQAKLTPRQQQVLELLAEGVELPDIASRLFVSPGTVRKHIERIYRALGVRSRGEAVAWAFNNGLVQPRRPRRWG